jgi:hypothetical protein
MLIGWNTSAPTIVKSRCCKSIQQGKLKNDKKNITGESITQLSIVTTYDLSGFTIKRNRPKSIEIRRGKLADLAPAGCSNDSSRTSSSTGTQCSHEGTKLLLPEWMQIVSGLGTMVREYRAHRRGGPWTMGWGGVTRACSHPACSHPAWSAAEGG